MTIGRLLFCFFLALASGGVVSGALMTMLDPLTAQFPGGAADGIVAGIALMWGFIVACAVGVVSAGISHHRLAARLHRQDARAPATERRPQPTPIQVAPVAVRPRRAEPRPVAVAEEPKTAVRGDRRVAMASSLRLIEQMRSEGAGQRAPRPAQVERSWPPARSRA